MSDIQIYGSSFKGEGRKGDFSFMIRQMLDQGSSDCLFIFNDNVEDHTSCVKGGGNALIRVYNIHSGNIPPLSAGIPTGMRGKGFASLESNLAKKHIDDAVEEVKVLLEMNTYRSMYFSSASDGLIGSGIFNIGHDVRQYITDKIKSLTKHPVIYDKEACIPRRLTLDPFASLPENKRDIAEQLKSFGISRSNNVIMEALKHGDTLEECAEWISENLDNDDDDSVRPMIDNTLSAVCENSQPNAYPNISSMISSTHIPKAFDANDTKEVQPFQSPSYSYKEPVKFPLLPINSTNGITDQHRKTNQFIATLRNEYGTVPNYTASMFDEGHSIEDVRIVLSNKCRDLLSAKQYLEGFKKLDAEEISIEMSDQGGADLNSMYPAVRGANVEKVAAIPDLDQAILQLEGRLSEIVPEYAHHLLDFGYDIRSIEKVARQKCPDLMSALEFLNSQSSEVASENLPPNAFSNIPSEISSNYIPDILDAGKSEKMRTVHSSSNTHEVPTKFPVLPINSTNGITDQHRKTNQFIATLRNEYGTVPNYTASMFDEGHSIEDVRIVLSNKCRDLLSAKQYLEAQKRIDASEQMELFREVWDGPNTVYALIEVENSVTAKTIPDVNYFITQLKSRLSGNIPEYARELFQCGYDVTSVEKVLKQKCVDLSSALNFLNSGLSSYSVDKMARHKVERVPFKSAAILFYRYSADGDVELLLGSYFDTDVRTNMFSLLEGEMMSLQGRPRSYAKQAAERFNSFVRKALPRYVIDSLAASLEPGVNLKHVQIIKVDPGSCILYLVSTKAHPFLRFIEDEQLMKIFEANYNLVVNSPDREENQRWFDDIVWKKYSTIQEENLNSFLSDLLSLQSFRSIVQEVIDNQQREQRRLFQSWMNRARRELEKISKTRKELSKEERTTCHELPDIPTQPIPTDIIVLDPKSADYQSALQRAQGVSFNVSCIKKINMPERLKRFNQYKKSLSTEYQGEKEVFHGTKMISSGNSIARNGPDLSIAPAHGRVWGHGFYTASDARTSEGYSGAQGCLLLCRIAPGNMRHMQSGDGSLTAAALSALNPPYNSVTNPSNWHIMFHPDSVLVEYIIDHGQDPDGLSPQERLRLVAQQNAKKKRDTDELRRKNRYNEVLSQMAMCNYFENVCIRIANMRELPANADMATIMEHFENECRQFDSKAPVYEKKGEFLKQMRGNQVVMLKGGTGIGKSVWICQWCFDNILSSEGKYSSLPVAVLVPRKAIALGLSDYVSKIRGVKVGEEIGVGTHDYFAFGPSTQIAFFTYGFFQAMTTGQNFSNWGMIIMDEAHERVADADVLLSRVADECRRRQDDFKVLIMSATIDLEDFSSKFTEKFRINIPTITIDGIKYPIEVIWHDGIPWDPFGEGAVNELVIETLRIFNQEVGNILVFLPTVQNVDDCVSVAKGMLVHDDSTSIFGLYSAIDDTDRKQIETFDQNRENANRRFICFATNVAEAGITIPNITAVIDTGREISMTYNLLLRTNVGTMAWISKASHMQRRGRAGRTAPGRCYNLFSQSDFETMEDYSVPAVMRINCESLLLGLIANGITENNLMQWDQDRMTDAQLTLKHFGAIEDDGRGVVLTPDGLTMSQLPIDLSLSKAIIAGKNEGIARCMIIIATMSQNIERNCLFIGSNGEKRNLAKSFRLGGSGDLEMYLNVYEMWEMIDDDDNRDSWCREHRINQHILKAAKDLVERIIRKFSEFGEQIDKGPSRSPWRSHLIRKSLCLGLLSSAAMSCDPQRSKEGFLVVRGYESNPVKVKIHHTSCIDQNEPVEAIIFHRQTFTVGGDHIVSGITVISKEDIREATFGTYTGKEAGEYSRKLENVGFDEEIITSEYIRHELEFKAFHKDVLSLKKNFPMYQIKDANNKDGLRVAIRCPKQKMPTVTKSVRTSLLGSKRASHAFSNISNIGGYCDQNNQPLERGNALLRGIREILQDLDDGIVEMEYKYKESKVVISASVALLQAAVRKCANDIGINHPLPSIRHIHEYAVDKRERFRLLFDKRTSFTRIRENFGDGQVGTIFALAHMFLWETDCWIYGGFIRDFLIGGYIHDEMDLDVALPTNAIKSMNHQEVMNLIKPMIERRNIKFLSQTSNGPYVLSVTFKSIDGKDDVVVEIVDSAKFARSDGTVDFNVNNLKIAKSGDTQLELKLKYEGQGGSIQEIEKDIERHRSKLLKSNQAQNMAFRIAKMQNRGWNIYS